MLVLDAYVYVFYRLYRFASRWKGDMTTPHITAFLGIIAIAWCNLFLLLVVAHTILAPRRLVIPHLSTFGIYVSFAVLAAPLYFAFLHRKRYQQIAARCELESSRQQRVRGVAIVISLVPWLIFVSLGTIRA